MYYKCSSYGKNTIMGVCKGAGLCVHKFFGKFRLILGNTPSPVRVMSWGGKKATFS